MFEGGLGITRHVRYAHFGIFYASGWRRIALNPKNTPQRMYFWSLVTEAIPDMSYVSGVEGDVLTMFSAGGNTRHVKCACLDVFYGSGGERRPLDMKATPG